MEIYFGWSWKVIENDFPKRVVSGHPVAFDVNRLCILAHCHVAVLGKSSCSGILVMLVQEGEEAELV